MMVQAYSNLMKEIVKGKFVYTGELEPEKTTEMTQVISDAKELAGYAVACNVTDNPKSCGYLSSLAASYLVQRDANMETVYQLTCRDRNRLALISDLLGAGALGIKNVLALTGDHTMVGDNPASKPVFDLDSAQLTSLIKMMSEKEVDLAGCKIEHPPQLNVGVAANPNADPLEPELLKLERKAKAGADFVQTQVVFDIEKAKNFLREASRFNVPLLIGIFPLKNYGIADFFNKNVPGCSVPAGLLDKLKQLKENIQDKEERKRKTDEMNVEYFTDFIKELKKTKGCRGAHVMAVGYASVTKQLIDRVGH
jgi:methylenetetrahydrofolate reductase (NADPH)